MKIACILLKVLSAVNLALILFFIFWEYQTSSAAASIGGVYFYLFSFALQLVIFAISLFICRAWWWEGSALLILIVIGFMV